jgi:hypothetical protein
MKTWRNECPELVEPEGRREDDTRDQCDLDLQVERAKDSTDEKVSALGRTSSSNLCKVTDRQSQLIDDRVVEEPPHEREESDEKDSSCHPLSEFSEMLEERHARLSVTRHD